MQRKRSTLALVASGLLLMLLPPAAHAGDLHFGDVPVGSSKVLRINGGLGMSSASAVAGGSCAKGMLTTRVTISGADGSEFQDLGGTYVGLHVPGNRYFEDIRFTPISPGDKAATFLPDATPVNPSCGLRTRPSHLYGHALPPKHHYLLAHIKPKRHVKQIAPAPGSVATPTPSLQASHAEPLPTINTLAALSRNVYSGNSAVYGYSFIGDTCTFLHDACNTVGFIATAYQSSDHTQIIIALRGSSATQTSLRDGLYDLSGDTAIAAFSVKLRTELAANTAAAADFLRFIGTHYSKANITLTGHSLGGAMAQLLSNASGDSAYVFNAPGMNALFTHLAIPIGTFAPTHVSRPQNINIRMYGDQISSGGVPLGRVVTIQNPATLTLPNNAASASAAVCTNLLPTLTQLHSMDTILTQIIHDAPTVDASQEINLSPALTANMWCEDPNTLF